MMKLSKWAAVFVVLSTVVHAQSREQAPHGQREVAPAEIASREALAAIREADVPIGSRTPTPIAERLLTARVVGSLSTRSIRVDRVVRRPSAATSTAYGYALDEMGLAIPGSQVQLTTDGRYAYGATWLPGGGGYELQSRGDGLIAKPFDVSIDGSCGCPSADCSLPAADGAPLVPAQANPPSEEVAVGLFNEEPFAFSKKSEPVILNSGPPCFSGDNRVFTVLVVVNEPTVVTFIGDNATDDEIRVYAESAVDLINTALMNSELDYEARVADVFFDVDLPQGTKFGSSTFIGFSPKAEILSALASGEEGAAARERREETCADFVASILQSSDGGGIAQLGGDNPKRVYSTTDPSSVFFTNVLVHEVGHNLGARHQPGGDFVLGSPPFLPDMRGFAAFNKFNPQQIDFTTVMGVGSFNRILFFSDPDREVNGVKIGVPDVQDVVKACEITIPLSTEYRESPKVAGENCDFNIFQDDVIVAANPAIDGDFNGLIDFCQIENDPSLDCDQNGIIDSAERLGLVLVELDGVPLVAGETTHVVVPDGLPEAIAGPATLLVNIDADLTTPNFNRNVTIDVAGGASVTTPDNGIGNCTINGDVYLPFGGQTYSNVVTDAAQGIPTISITVPDTVPQINECGRSISARLRIYARRPVGTFDASSIDADLDGVLNVCECRADVNGDGQLSSDDFNAWLTAFLNDTPIADQNNDGLIAADDFNAWLSGFIKGCP
ncbi:MAG: GC-type dockerin domain-anchored protein [Planctomycetota bacterium]